MKGRISILFVAIFTVIAGNTFADDITAQGKSLFTSRCASCHKLGAILTGPDLVDVDKRRNIEWLIQWIKSSQTVIKKGDKDAAELFEKFNKMPMPDQPDLADADIRDILAYIKIESANAPKDKVPFATPGIPKIGYTPISIHNYGFILSYLALVGVLVGVLFFAVNVATLKKNSPDKNTSVTSPIEQA
ncbi:MAG: cytochrome c [Ginsengibacter sp.]